MNDSPKPKDKKPISIKKAADKILTKELSKLGYEYDNHYTKSGIFAFFKKVDGFNIGLILIRMNYGNSLDVALITSAPPDNRERASNIYYALTGSYRELKLSTQEELENELEKIRDLFITEGYKWVEKYKLENFNPYKIYEDIVDPFFDKYKYKRISMDDNLLAGGTVSYSNKSTKFLFQHSGVKASITCSIVKNNIEENIGRFIEEHRKFGYVGYFYRNEAEYIDSINKLLRYIEEYDLINIKENA